MRDADWRHASGPKSSINTQDNHPVVHVSFADAAAYAKRAGKDIPTVHPVQRIAALQIVDPCRPSIR